MKRLILAVMAAGTLVGLGFYVNRPKPQPDAPAETVAESVAEPGPVAAADEAPQIEAPAVSRERPAPPAAVPVRPNPPPVSASVTPALDASLLSRTVDVLVSPQATYQQKREAWKQLRDAGKLDLAIADLEQRTVGDSRSAEYPAALGQAYLQKCGTIQDVREQGILAMQADKVFDTALALDPANWEARFTKAVALSHWPPMLNKGEEVIQHFQTLIQLQETQAPQPQFAETYSWLGDQYQKAGKTEDARTVWQRGAALFPGDEKLRTKLAPAP